MKTFPLFCLTLFVFLVKSQTITDYKYVLVPSEFNDFKESKSYNLSALLTKSLKSKKYSVLSDSKNDWPQDALLNPCKILTSDIINDGGFLRNKLILEFKDCNKKVVFSEKSSSSIKEYEPGYQDALKQAMGKVLVSNPSEQIEKLAESKPQEDVKKVRTVNENPASIVQKYTNAKLSLQKIQINDDQFILVDGNSSVPFATFQSTTKADVFRVKLSSGKSTIGYYENENIVIEMPLNTGDFAKTVFSAN